MIITYIIFNIHLTYPKFYINNAYIFVILLKYYHGTKKIYYLQFITI